MPEVAPERTVLSEFMCPCMTVRLWTNPDVWNEIPIVLFLFKIAIIFSLRISRPFKNIKAFFFIYYAIVQSIKRNVHKPHVYVWFRKTYIHM